MIVLRAKSVSFDVTYINLREKPDWFLAISPHGKVPVLKVDDARLFESNAIAEFLDEVETPRLHPSDPIKRAHHRAWTDFVPQFAAGLSGTYYPSSEAQMRENCASARERLAKLDDAIRDERTNAGPYFDGETLCLVDAAYAPFFQRFLLVEDKLQTGLLNDFPRVNDWAAALMANDLVTGSVPENFPTEFTANLKRRNAFVAQYFEASDAAD